ncbi:hypothetical protein ACFWB0_11075 [Rhodococcus sp. NPDC060086]|uniref:hypothetical protein n=1 Tax=Rhodococcus sp. NPDC060086 TaxID=3347055 RepID=UPI00365BE081
MRPATGETSVGAGQVLIEVVEDLGAEKICVGELRDRRRRRRGDLTHDGGGELALEGNRTRGIVSECDTTQHLGPGRVQFESCRTGRDRQVRAGLQQGEYAEWR